ncbi:hypothetical protein EA473_16235 [Natrarchaeobius chitinivorans]|uniref:Uncharacterized protein n=1 Tax=Natrarchaeobius chitinivorans TaxID=1679083 RepID=A0A3N6MF85_NATCH|nr:hypothetical protein EA473_16235 [Natrarchaeobius chitinivorans]
MPPEQSEEERRFHPGKDGGSDLDSRLEIRNERCREDELSASGEGGDSDRIPALEPPDRTRRTQESGEDERESQRGSRSEGTDRATENRTDVDAGDRVGPAGSGSVGRTGSVGGRIRRAWLFRDATAAVSAGPGYLIDPPRGSRA